MLQNQNERSEVVCTQNGMKPLSRKTAGSECPIPHKISSKTDVTPEGQTVQTIIRTIF